MSDPFFLYKNNYLISQCNGVLSGCCISPIFYIKLIADQQQDKKGHNLNPQKTDTH